MKYQFLDKIALKKDTDQNYRRNAVEFARAMGFSCEAAEFPVTTWGEGLTVPESVSDIRDFEPVPLREAEKIPDDYTASSDSPLPLPELDLRRQKGLECIFSKGPFLKDENHDGLPDKMDVHLVLPKEASDSQLMAAVNVAFRLGMETTGYEGSLLREASMPGNEIIFADGKDFSVSYEEKSDGVKVYISGDGKTLEDGISMFSENFPLQGEFDTLSDRMMEIADELASRYADADCGKKDEKPVYEKEYELSWEVDDLRAILSEKLYPRISAGDNIKVYAAVSEDKEVRSSLEKEISEVISQKGAASEVDVICSYKQGYSWIDEKINPILVSKGNVCRVEIYFKPFLPEGETDWKDEDGATPKYNNVKADPEHWYDLPIRYLQELYPIEDTIVEALRIKRDDVVFAVYEGDEKLTYLLRAFDSDGVKVFEDRYLAANSERPYLEDFPQLGKVHPATGFLRAYVNGKEILSERICSDVEKIWDIYQGEVLPGVREYADRITEGKDPVKEQPFFSKLQLDITVSEPNEKLPSREDIFSSLDGLHEDLYFAGTDYFKNYGLEKCGEITDAPGLILPVIKKREGKPYFKVSLYAAHKSAAKPRVEVWMKRLEVRDGKTTAVLNTDPGNFSVNVFPEKAEEKTVNIEDIDLLEHTLIGYEQCMEILDKLKKVPGVMVYRTARSYQGRSLYAVELKPHLKGYISRVKRITNHPVEIINTRHHANEVSGTNEAFMLIKRILTDKKYENLADEMNLILVPMENVDGAAIHYELQKDNPTWKFHVARFNALGKEFFYDHFSDDTIHTEAKGLKRLFLKWLPDVLVDNHGVPSHEWEQQFSGYTSPSYRGFWLPRSLIYGYFFHIEEERYRSNIALNKKVEDAVADAFLSDEEITGANLSWARQFEKYAHAWMPKLFPANYYKNMINYWIPSPYDPSHRYPSIRYPWILSVDYVSEVADETAQGDYLYLCARSHLVQDLAIIDMILDCSYVYKKEWIYSGDEIKAEITRKRPVIAK